MQALAPKNLALLVGRATDGFAGQPALKSQVIDDVLNIFAGQIELIEARVQNRHSNHRVARANPSQNLAIVRQKAAASQQKWDFRAPGWPF